MVIRKEQMNVLENAGSAAFDNELAEHLWRYAPRLSKVIGAEGVRQVVKLARQRAASYGLTYRGPVRFYMEMMVAFGSGFDSDYQLPWAGKILRTKYASQMDCAESLYEAMLAYYSAAMGPRNEYGMAALRKFANTPAQSFIVGSGDRDARIIAGLRGVYPQKCNYVGDAILIRLVRQSAALAVEFSVDTDAGTGLFVGLSFGFGHDFPNDPLYPWMRRTLDDPLITTADDRILRLYEKLKVYVQRVLAEVGTGQTNG